MTNIALDSNVLVYLAGVGREPQDQEKMASARKMVGKLRRTEDIVAPVQALGELFIVLRRNGFSPDEARATVVEMEEGFETAPTLDTTLAAALDLATEHKLQFWDSMILSAAAETGCSLLLSEDMQDGFVTRGVTIANPFAEKLHLRLARLLT